MLLSSAASSCKPKPAWLVTRPLCDTAKSTGLGVARSRPSRMPKRGVLTRCAAPAPSSHRSNRPVANIFWQRGGVEPSAKEAMLGQKGCIVWMTGLSGAGKSTVATRVEHVLASRGTLTALLDGDNLRHGLCADLGFSEEARAENVRRVGEVAKLLADTGIVVIAALVSPYALHRDVVRERVLPGRFVEVFVDTPLPVCESRDPKKLYAAARAGRLQGLTGVDSPYEPPTHPELVLSGDGIKTPQMLADCVVAHLEAAGLIPATNWSNNVAAFNKRVDGCAEWEI